MAKFEVHYSFTCGKCKTKNENRIEIDAPDRLAAYQFALASSECSECKTPVDLKTAFYRNNQTGWLTGHWPAQSSVLA
jgi:hypothetical protein